MRKRNNYNHSLYCFLEQKVLTPMYLYKCVYHRKKNLSPVQSEYIRAEDKVMAYTEFCRRWISDGWKKGKILQDAEVEIIRDASHNQAGKTKITRYNK